MRFLKHTAKKRIELRLVALARLFRTRLPETEWPHYEMYMAQLGRDNFIEATSIAEQRANPQLWIGASPEQYRIIRQAYSLCEKISREGDHRAQEAAWQKFLNCEKKCGRTNRKIRYLMLRPDRWRSLSRGDISIFDVTKIKREISLILGDFWKAYTSLVQELAFGPGMSLSSADVNKTSVPFKLSDKVTVTESALPVWRDFMRYGGLLPGRVEFSATPSGVFKRVERVQIVPGCKITFVPKTSVIKRTIAIEPSANVSMQLTIHRYLQKRLRRWADIDITDQTKNRRLALQGSLSGDLATLDLSSASDLISKEVVRLLLPKEWFHLLDALRSHCGTYGDNSIVFQKFSSMGNGFTFALETIIFYAIAKVAGEGVGSDLPSVYGDDIIVRTSDYSRTVKFLEFFGFSVNSRKSYNSGPFRESCGLDAFNGVDVRPIFLRTDRMKIVEAIAFHNHCYRRGYYDVCELVRMATPEHLRVFGPPGPEAGFFFTEDPDILRRHRKYDRDTQSYTYLAISEVGKRMKYHERLLLESSLYGGGVYSSGAPLRSITKLVMVATHRDY